MIQPSTYDESRPIVVTEIEQFGGAERSVLALARWLHQHNLPAHIVAYSDRCNLASRVTFPLHVIELNPPGGARGKISARGKIAALGAHLNARSAHAPKPLLSGYQPALHATVAGLRGFHTLMHDTPSLFANPEGRSLKSGMRLAVSNRTIGHGMQSGGATIVTSEYLQGECRREFGVDAHIVRMGGLAPGELARVGRFRVRPVTTHLRMLSVCRIEANKRIDWILRALANLEQASLSSLIDWRLDLAGKGPLIEPLAALAASLGIADRVHFHGFVADDRLQQLYDRAHLFLMPAVQGYGIPAIESLQRGTPVLLHRESGVSDILRNTPWATVVPSGEPTMTACLRVAIQSVLEGRHHAVPPPLLPTEDEWAAEVAHLCNWLP